MYIGIGRIIYLVESTRRVREAVVLNRCGTLYTLRFTDSGGGIRLRADRLYPTREAAQASLRREEAQPVQPPSRLWHNVPLCQC